MIPAHKHRPKPGLEEAVALITQFTEIHKDTNQVHGAVECGYTMFERRGSTYLQLDTYGSRDRKFQGKVSQSIQLDSQSAAELQRLIRRAFPELP
jgi:hypothetical protein